MKVIKLSFILIELFLFILIIFVVKGATGIALRYLSILLCFLYVFIQPPSIDKKMLSVAFLLTLIADLFLLVIGKYFIIGVGVFILVQTLYCYRLKRQSKNSLHLYTIIGVIVVVESLLWLVFRDGFDLLLFVTGVYFTMLLTNVLNGFITWKSSPLFAIGLLLFLFCDIFVGINNAHNYAMDYGLLNKINNSIIDFQWLFYIPSQVLIALSTKKTQFSNCVLS